MHCKILCQGVSPVPTQTTGVGCDGKEGQEKGNKEGIERIERREMGTRKGMKGNKEWGHEAMGKGGKGNGRGSK